ncbi:MULTISPECIES: transposase family protein [unclassified Acidithiobacillus]|uniref:transposase family protein n=1 Tax=unclassified Acidithiobacillus TaxID=2614800 RepID=UPI001D0D5D6E|nr:MULTISPECIES: transposase family protein [unclassified Acidithiobacillus]
MLKAEEMRALPLCFSEIKDPRRPQGRRHRLSVVLGIAAGATLCGMSGYKSMADWAMDWGKPPESVSAAGARTNVMSFPVNL